MSETRTIPIDRLRAFLDLGADSLEIARRELMNGPFTVVDTELDPNVKKLIDQVYLNGYEDGKAGRRKCIPMSYSLDRAYSLITTYPVDDDETADPD